MMDSDSQDNAYANTNPFAPPTADIGITRPDPSDVEIIRQRYLQHEASIKSVGILYMLPAGFFILVGISGVVMGVVSVLAVVEVQDGGLESLLRSLAALGVGCLFLAIALQIRKLRRWPLLPLGFLSVVGLLHVPLGTVINGYILWLLFGSKGRYVMSAEYQRVIAATPHMKYRTSIIVIFFAIVLAILSVLMLTTGIWWIRAVP